MIHSLKLDNFKRFSSFRCDLKRLTLLTGVNSGGKSSVIQSLLLLHSRTVSGDSLALNGPYALSLGEASNVIHSGAELSDEVRLGLSTDDFEGEIRLHVPDNVPDGRATTLTVGHNSIPQNYVPAMLLNRRFTYLCAERLGPRDTFEIGSEVSEHLSVGYAGQFTAHVLTQLERETVPALRLHPETENRGNGVATFKTQVRLWMSSLIGDIDFNASWVPETTTATLMFRGNDREWYSPNNVGFGISYVLPIVVAGLAAPVNNDPIFIVENPEAHLHPAAQSAIGSFLARIAGSGVQVIVETHSDHVLNGIRRAVAVDKVMSAGDVGIYYFDRNAEPVLLSVDEFGKVSSWPAGFFDQAENDLTDLARIRYHV